MSLSDFGDIRQLAYEIIDQNHFYILMDCVSCVYYYNVRRDYKRSSFYGYHFCSVFITFTPKQTTHFIDSVLSVSMKRL